LSLTRSGIENSCIETAMNIYHSISISVLLPKVVYDYWYHRLSLKQNAVFYRAADHESAIEKQIKITSYQPGHLGHCNDQEMHNYESHLLTAWKCRTLT